MLDKAPAPAIPSRVALEGATIDINLVKVNRAERQRREIAPDEALQASISRVGLLHPLVLSRDYTLRAGERRLEALRALGWTRVPVRWFESLDPVEAELVELEENVRRKSLPWQDEVRAVAKIDAAYRARAEADGEDWTQRKSCLAIGISDGQLSLSIRVAQALGEERIAKAGTAREAYNILARRDSRAQGDALAELLEIEPNYPMPVPQPLYVEANELGGEEGLSDGRTAPDFTSSADRTPDSGPALRSPTPSPASPLAPPHDGAPAAPSRPDIRNEDFLAWLQGSGPCEQQRFNLVHCDFPYGIELFAGGQGQGAEPEEGYADSPDVYFALLEAFCKNLDKFMALSAHLVFWFSGKHRAATTKMFAQLTPSLDFYPYDLVWHKSDNAGIAGDHRRHPRHTHETALLATRSRRHILGPVADSYSCPTNKTLHPSTKPEPMLRHFFRMFVDEHSRVFDPTCGSGASIRAADSLGAGKVLGLEIDPSHAAVALRELELERRLRGTASRSAPR